jgi:hypothetical protein
VPRPRAPRPRPGHAHPGHARTTVPQGSFLFFLFVNF